MEYFTRFIKQNPLLAAGIFCVLMIGLYYLFSTGYAAYKINKLERENAALTEQQKKLEGELEQKKTEFAESQGIIKIKEEELVQKDAILQAFTQQVAENKIKLDKVAANYNDARNNTEPMSSTELRQRLCNLYPSRCN
jgi:predicted nuclease with TOPRIM domain